ncbi:MAG: ATP-binding protein [Myxococcota bacterium]|nr:ATP-binding protein [Myxococcota bacterium]
MTTDVQVRPEEAERLVSPEGNAVAASAPVCVVGIGASAGGLDALERFFDNLPRGTGMAFVVVQHLSPDFRSMMDELLARHTELPVRLVEDGETVEANRVYLIPPGKEMIISGGRLLLTERDKQQELSLPIDVFFRSLAQDCGPRAVAIVLSGGGSDGSRGVKAVHEAGGLVIVQDVESAQFDGMPKTARDAGVAEWVLAPHEMPAVLLRHSKSARPGQPLHGASKRVSGTSKGFDAIYEMLETEFGLDFTHYKPSTVTRRIERRLALARAHDIEPYVATLRRERAELDILYGDLLIGVTRFFRNEEAFEALENDVLPELLGRGRRDVPFRAWIAGCATGEEAYSLAITLQEAMARVGERPIKIFATDVHRGSLERAARGVYEAEAVANVSPERLDRYFQRVGHTYQVVPDLRQMIVFAPHNVIKDAPFTRVDMISCRNLLIYLQPPAQQKALSLFHFALNRGGVLFLGPSESPGHLASDYETLDKHWRLYRKFSDVRVPVEARLQPPRPAEARHVGTTANAAAPRYSLSHLLGTYDTLLDEFVPPSLLVNDRGELVHAFAGASRFLKPHDGRQALDVLELVDAELKIVLSGAIRRALAEPAAIVFNGVRVSATAEKTTLHRVTVRRVASSRQRGPLHVLITFHALHAAPVEAAPESTETEFNLDKVSRDQLRALEAELNSTKESLQATIEELEAANEELQASNEELQASNEELQSTNEELQSVNEELYTVNAEHQRKIGELVELTNDMDNLLSSTDIGTIFLDADLNIRKFTPRIAETFNLVPHDVGRSIETFAHTLHHAPLVDELKTCLSTGERVEREIRDVRGRCFFLRILPYRARGNVGGVVLTLIDASGLKAAEDALFHERYLLNSLLFSVPDAICFKDVRGRFIRANHAMGARLRLADPGEAAGKTAYDLMDEATARSQWAAEEAVIRSGEPQTYVLEKRFGKDGVEAWDLVSRLPLRDRAGIVGVIGIYRDVTREKHAEAKIQEAVRRRDQFLAMLSHELRNPLGAIVTATRLLKLIPGSAAPPARILETLERQSGQMARLLDDLLEASRVTQNKIELRRAVVDLGAVTNEAVDAVRGLMEARGLELSVETVPGACYVDGDPARLQQIQVNLLNNAAKYTPCGGHVRLRAAREGSAAVIRVQDDGAGISPNMLESVFDLFVQSSSTLDRSDGGLGLGLTLVRSLVDMHGGTVTAESEGPGKGSQFVVRLPLASPPRDVQTVARSRLPSGPSTTQGAKVVVVEDNEDSRHMLCSLLEHAGFDCKSAGTGLEGLALIDATLPDVAILDVGLPEMDGLELARRIRKDPRHEKVHLLALTGYGQPADRSAACEAGFDGHLVKPVDPDQLVKRLSQAVANHTAAPPSA